MKTNIVKKIFHTTVFSDGSGGGNPCPVVFDADELSAEQAMWLANKYFAEVVLVTSATGSEAGFRLRFFVPRHEMEMCVHGTIAAVTVLRSLDHIGMSPVKIETALGLITVEWSKDGRDTVVTVNQFAPEFAVRNPSPAEVAEVLRLPRNAPILADLPIASVSTSRFKLIVPLRNVQQLDRLEPNFNAIWSLCDRFDTTGFYPFAPVIEEDGRVYSARQFPKRAGLNEDPATGVAACALGAYLTRYCTQREGWNGFEIQQGRAMGRPSRLSTKAYFDGRSIRHVSVTGKATILDRESIPSIR